MSAYSNHTDQNPKIFRSHIYYANHVKSYKPECKCLNKGNVEFESFSRPSLSVRADKAGKLVQPELLTSIFPPLLKVTAQLVAWKITFVVDTEAAVLIILIETDSFLDSLLE